VDPFYIGYGLTGCHCGSYQGQCLVFDRVDLVCDTSGLGGLFLEFGVPLISTAVVDVVFNSAFPLLHCFVSFQMWLPRFV